MTWICLIFSIIVFLCSCSLCSIDGSKLALCSSAMSNSRSAGKEILCLLWYLNVLCYVHNSPPLVPILCQINLVRSSIFYFFIIHINIIFPSTSMSPKWTLQLAPPNIWWDSGSHGGGYENGCLLGCCAVYSGRSRHYRRGSKHFWNVGKLLTDYTKETTKKTAIFTKHLGWRFWLCGMILLDNTLVYPPYRNEFKIKKENGCNMQGHRMWS
jgi:hypothetical protein